MYKYKNSINVVIVIVGIIISVVTYFKSQSIDEYYKLVFCIPVVYTSMFVFSNNNRKIFGNIGILIINIVLFIRFLIYPLIFVYTFKYGTYIGVTEYVNTSIYLMIYECVAVFLFLNWWGKKRLQKIQNVYKRELQFLTKYDIIIVIVLILFLVATFFHPVLLQKYFSYKDSNNEVGSQRISGVLSVFFKIGIYVIFIFILNFFYKTLFKSTKLLSLFLSVIVSLFIIASESNRASGDVSRWGFLIFSISILLIISNLYKDYSKWIWGFSLPAILVSTVLLTVIKFGDDFSFEGFILKYFSTLSLDYYFMGIENVSYGLATYHAFDYKISFNTMLTDMFSAVPLISNFFDPANNSTPVFFHIFMGRTDTIIPTIVQSYSYFGIIGAPFMSILFTFLTIEANRMLNRTKDIILNFILSQQTIVFSLFMAINTNIIFESTWWRLVFLILIFLNIKFPIFTKRVATNQFF